MNPYTQRLHEKIDEFLQDWLDWAEGRPHKDEHDERVGLCSNLAYYARDQPEDVQDDISDEFRKLLVTQPLQGEEPCETYPFDSNYWAYNACEDMRLNPKRLAWVKQRLGAEAS